MIKSDRITAEEVRVLRRLSDEELTVHGWVLWTVRRTRAKQGELRVNVTTRGVANLSVAAFQALGHPQFVQQLVDARGRRVALKKSDAPLPGARRVQGATKQFSLQALAKQFAVAPGSRTCHVQDGHLIFDMDLPGEAQP